jgi:hypothetical protein
MNKDERRELYHAVFKTPQGIKVLEDLSRMCEFKHTSFDPEPMKMANKEGKKELYRYIQKQLEAK